MLVLNGWKHRLARKFRIPHRVGLHTAVDDYTRACLDAGIDPMTLAGIADQMRDRQSPDSPAWRAFASASDELRNAQPG